MAPKFRDTPSMNLFEVMACAGAFLAKQAISMNLRYFFHSRCSHIVHNKLWDTRAQLVWIVGRGMSMCRRVANTQCLDTHTLCMQCWQSLAQGQPNPNTAV